jgi:restriction endonuclease S subunit
MDTEYPNKLNQTIGSASDLKTPKELHPAFYGCFDWHSAVHGHWSLVRLLKQFPDLEQKTEIEKQLLQNISKENIKSIQIPVPSIEQQEEIVKYLDFIYEKTNKISIEKIKDLKTLNKYCLNNQKIFGKNSVKKLDDIITYNSGKRLPKGHELQNNKTPYPYIRITDIDKNSILLDNIKYISLETKNIINKYIITINDIYITIAGTTGLVGIIPYELDGANLTENALRINIINKKEILQKYLVYELHYNQQEELKKKTGIGKVDNLIKNTF